MTPSQHKMAKTMSEITYLESLAHLKFVLIRKVLHQSRNLQSFLGTLLKKLERDDLQTMLDRSGDLSRMWSRNLCYGICLANDEKVLDFSNVVPSFALDGTLDNEEIGLIRLMSEKRCANEVVV